MKQSVSNPYESLWFSSPPRPSINVLTPGFSLAPAVGRVPKETRKLPDLRFSVLELRGSGGGPLAASSLRLVELLRPRLLGPHLAHQRLASGIMQTLLPRPASGLEAFVCRSTPGNHPARQRPAGETWGGAHGGSGAGSGFSVGLSFSVRIMGGGGGESGLRR